MLIYSWLLWQVLINETPFLNLDFLMNTCQQCRSNICGDMTVKWRIINDPLLQLDR